MKKNKKESILGLAMVLPSFILMATIVFFPVIQSIILSFTDGDTNQFTLNNYITLFTNKNHIDNIVYTIYIVILTVIFTIVLGYLLALYTHFYDSLISRIVKKMYVITRFVPGIVAVYALMAVIKDTGAMNRFLMMFGIDFKPSLLYTAKGIVLVNLWFNIPFAAMIIESGLSEIQTSIIDSARDVGASLLTVFKSIILPLSAKSALIATTFVFMSNVGSFTTPFLIGTNAPKMLGVALQQEFSVFYNPEMASTISVFMFILSAIVGAFYISSMMKEDKWATQG